MPKRKLHPMNNVRASQALKAIKAANYEHLHGGLVDGLNDLLIGLRHLCDREGFDWEDQLRRVENTYQVEAVEPDDIEQDCRRLEGMPA
jgi:hypothetical protein